MKDLKEVTHPSQSQLMAGYNIFSNLYNIKQSFIKL